MLRGSKLNTAAHKLKIYSLIKFSILQTVVYLGFTCLPQNSYIYICVCVCWCVCIYMHTSESYL